MSRCTARSKRTGEQCGCRAMAGQSVCRSHGGSTPQARRRAQERIIEAQAAEVVQRHGVIAPVVNSLRELSALAGEVLSLKNVLAERIHDGNMDGPYIAAYERSLDRTGRLLADLARLDLDERLVAISEAQATLIVDAVTSTLRDLGFEGEQLMLARQSVARRLRAARPALEGPR